MSYICHECHSKIFGAKNKALEEINSRLDAGEKPEDLVVEYENEELELIKSRDCNCERIWFLDAAIDWCMRELALSKVSRAGWTKNRSGKWVKNKE